MARPLAGRGDAGRADGAGRGPVGPEGPGGGKRGAALPRTACQRPLGRLAPLCSGTDPEVTFCRLPSTFCYGRRGGAGGLRVERSDFHSGARSSAPPLSKVLEVRPAGVPTSWLTSQDSAFWLKPCAETLAGAVLRRETPHSLLLPGPGLAESVADVVLGTTPKRRNPKRGFSWKVLGTSPTRMQAVLRWSVCSASCGVLSSFAAHLSSEGRKVPTPCSAA